MTVKTVKISIVGGPETTVAWTQGMNGQTALELAEDNLGDEFIYCIEYYGRTLGYLVNMINETYDTFKSSASPFFYWEFLVNGTPSSTGIDQTVLRDGDLVSFEFTTYNLEATSALMTAKHKRRAGK